MKSIPADILTHLVSLRPTSVGTVFTSGSGECGQLGAGCDILERNKLGKVELEGIVQVQAGGMHGLALTREGIVSGKTSHEYTQHESESALPADDQNGIDLLL